MIKYRRWFKEINLYDTIQTLVTLPPKCNCNECGVCIGMDDYVVTIEFILENELFVTNLHCETYKVAEDLFGKIDESYVEEIYLQVTGMDDEIDFEVEA
jgi:hypothetical protein